MTDLSQLRYLIIDDDKQSRVVLETLLRKKIGSSQVASFSDTASLPDQLSQLPFIPDVFFLDIMIEPYNGFEVLALLHSLESYQSARMVAVTARVMTENVYSMKEAGFDALIGKPIIRNVFPQLLEKIVAGEDIWYVA